MLKQQARPFQHLYSSRFHSKASLACNMIVSKPQPSFLLLVMQQAVYNNEQMAVGLGPFRPVACHVRSTPSITWVEQKNTITPANGDNELTY